MDSPAAYQLLGTKIWRFIQTAYVGMVEDPVHDRGLITREGYASASGQYDKSVRSDEWARRTRSIQIVHIESVHCINAISPMTRN